MSDVMMPINISQLMEWVLEEYKNHNSIFGVHVPYKVKRDYKRKIFERKLETPVGPAAGPHTQLSQNIIAAYVSGSRFFELKTVQKMDGRELAACVNKPCIKADDEGYNSEWSTELYVKEAMEEYIKAWFAISVISKEFGLGDMDGFQFNMSVGYDLDGIKSKKVDDFIESMKDAKDTEIFKECKNYFIENIDKYHNVSKEDIYNISSKICNSATISTLHGCPPQEIERIARYLIEEKGLNTFIKCNPTLLGYDFARSVLDSLGYGYISFGRFHFEDDLQYKDAVPMIKRLIDFSSSKGLQFGIKLTNTFPVDVKNKELPAQEMYMSGKSLYPLSINLASKLAHDFQGNIRISYSGGADYHNISRIVDSGIWPVTVATTLLKPGGYKRLSQMADLSCDKNIEFKGIDLEKIEALAKDALNDDYYKKPVKEVPSYKNDKKVPFIDCFIPSCTDGCPIHQDIPKYLHLVDNKKYVEALNVITDKNPLPFTTGTICPHKCMTKCTRNFYENAVNIRKAKLCAAENGYDEFMKSIKESKKDENHMTAIVGGGPAGLSAAYFLAKNGRSVTIFEKGNSLGGLVKSVIPEFRISQEAIEKDINMILSLGVKVKLNYEVKNINELKNMGYENIIIAVGAEKPGITLINGTDTINAIDYLKEFKNKDGNCDIGKRVLVIGGGNTAMDTARAAIRNKGVENVSIIYRRTKKYMPSDEEELYEALRDGVEFRELLLPESAHENILTCSVMEFSDMDSTNRRSVKKSGLTVDIPFDTIISAIGEKVESEFYIENGIDIHADGKPIVDKNTLETNISNVYVCGDGLNGPRTVVEAIADGIKAVSSILSKEPFYGIKIIDRKSEDEIYGSRGILLSADETETTRCLSCDLICENCIEVCPNRANVSIKVPELKLHQIVHIDSMCNECGNCRTFCPYDSAPYLDKFTLFKDNEAMKDSKNDGFIVLDDEKLFFKIRYKGKEYDYEYSENNNDIPKELGYLMKAVCKSYKYIFKKEA